MASQLPEYVPEGSLEDYPLPVLLTLSLDRKLSGTIHIESGEQKTWIYFQQGFPAAVHIPNSEVYLGMIMREMGLIDDAAFNESLMIMAKSGKLHGQVLIEMGKINQEQLVQAQLAQLMRKLTELFVLQSGSFRVEEGAPMPARLQPTRIHPFPVIYNGVRSCYQEEDLVAALEHLFRKKSCKLAGNFKERGSHLELPPEEGDDLGLLSVYRLPGQFVQRARCGRTAGMMLLVTLAYCGLLEVVEASRARELSRPGVKTLDSVRAEPQVPEKLKELQQALKEKVDLIKSGDLLKLVEVPRDFDEEGLKKAYLSLSKRFHPDRIGAVADDDFRKVAGFVLSKINEAYGTLSDPGKRAAYLKSVPLEAGEKRPADPEGALVAYEKAKVFINKKMNPQALEQLRLAHELDPSVAEYHARYLWYDFLCNPEQTRTEKLPRTRQKLLKLFEDYPGNFYVNRYLAQAFRLLKDEENYERHLNKAANIRPTDIETVRELRLHNSRKQKSEKKGLFLGLTRKK